MEEHYFLITNTEDGIFVEVFTKAALLTRLNADRAQNQDFFIGMNHSLNPQDWGDKCMLIKGSIVVPRPKMVTVEFEVE